ncbi:Meiotically up-regulated gene 72 protein [Smittium culicis]|uniref:2-dehydropantoate 2-reductase n=1 Tax=Smittium culicis TaxID=133412 RepID=A0A1R1XDZ6_9FUNG|nr:Meiotically up-regulated gene 72 protein [Smittium culicis]OMJ24245.1 Meiotically up-regulated gene 72 protein [Smittium culicis]
MGVNEQTKILLLGGGALGSIFGWRLQEGGCFVSVICRSNYEVVKASGYQIESVKYGNGNFVPDMVFKSCSEAIAKSDFVYDYILICTKSLPNISNPADLLKGCSVSESTVIVLIQNGIDIEKYFFEVFPKNVLISATAYIDTKQTDSGVIVHGERVSLYYGLYRPEGADGEVDAGKEAKSQALLEKLERCLVSGNVDSKILENIQRERWNKLIWNSTLNPISVLSGGSNSKEMLENPNIRQLVVNAMKETISVGEAVVKMPLEDFPSEDIPDLLIGQMLKRKNAVYPSMMMDYMFKRPMEHEVILHNAIKYADRLGIDVPILKTIYALILGTEAKYLKRAK